MAIIGMKRLSLYTLIEDRDPVLEDFIKQGSLELTELSNDELEKVKNLVMQDVADNKQKNEMLNIITNSLKVLDRYAPIKTGLFTEKHLVVYGDFNKKSIIEQNIQLATNINDILKEINDLWNSENQLNNKKLSIMPWLNCDVHLDFTGTEQTDFLFCVCPSDINLNNMTAEINSIIPECVINYIDSDKTQKYFTAIVHKASVSSFFSELKKYNANILNFNLSKTAQENLDNIITELQIVKNKRKELLNRLVEIKDKKIDLEKCYDAINIEINRDSMRNKLLKTDNILYFTGWVSNDKVDSTIQFLDKYNCAYDFTEPLDTEEPPVKLSSSKLIEPFTVVTEMYSLPSPRGIDPNAYMAPFFFVFFGIMLSDAGYGLLMAGACFFILRKYRMSGMKKQLISLLFLGGISTIIWGALFGSWFGDIFPVISKIIIGKSIAIKPLWFNPLEDPMKMLFFSFALGLIHIFAGMVIAAYMLIKRGKWLDAVFDIFTWFILIIGLLVMLISVEIGKYLAITGALALVLTQGRNEKNIIMKFLKGLLSLYNITAYFSDVLSYSRLLALGLATGVIASVINTMGSLLSGNIIGIIIMVIVFIGGHTFNLAINALGAYVHTSRLQYIEFYGKFYESGGVAFKPTYLETKYVEIIKEDI